MKIWLVTIGEPVPIQEGARDRLHRTGYFAHFLADQGHDVIWWTSTFDHFRKKNLFHEDTTLSMNNRLQIRLLYGCDYSTNVSLARFRNHRQIGRKFAALAREEANRPDVIVSGLPTIELCAESVKYARDRGVQTVLDIRDLWPDIFVDVLPSSARWLGRLALAPLFRSVRFALGNCTSIIAVSQGYLDWGMQHAGREPSSNDVVFPLGYSKPAVTHGELKRAQAALQGKGVDFSKSIIWFVGTFGKTYDLRTVIDAARRLDARGMRNAEFVLSGSGENYSALAEHAKGLSNVVFTGWIDAAEIACMMRVAHIGLMAYAKGAPQGHPNKLFEYMSAGIPIVSSLCGETDRLLSREGCGVTYKAEDVDGLAEMLLQLIEDEGRRIIMSGNCISLFEDRYRAEKIAAEMMAYLEQIVATTKPGSHVAEPVS